MTFTGHLSFFPSHNSHLVLQSYVFFQPLLAPRDTFFHVFLLFSFQSKLVESFQMVETGNTERICYYPPLSESYCLSANLGYMPAVLFVSKVKDCSFADGINLSFSILVTYFALPILY